MPPGLDPALRVGLPMDCPACNATQPEPVGTECARYGIVFSKIGVDRGLPGLRRVSSADEREPASSSDRPRAGRAALIGRGILYVGGLTQHGGAVEPAQRAEDGLPVVPLNLAAGEAAEQYQLDVLAQIVGHDLDVSQLPAGTPSAIRTLVRRCLEKDPRQRLQHVGDARLEIVDAGTPRFDAVAPVDPRTRGPAWMVLVGLIAGAVLDGFGVWSVTRSDDSEPVQRMAIPLPRDASYVSTNQSTPGLAVSQSGSHLVYVSTSGGVRQLYQRALDEVDGRLIAGTENAFYPFFSPDGESVAFLPLAELPIPKGAEEGVDSRWSASDVGSGFESMGWVLGTRRLDCVRGRPVPRWAGALSRGGRRRHTRASDDTRSGKRRASPCVAAHHPGNAQRDVFDCTGWRRFRRCSSCTAVARHWRTAHDYRTRVCAAVSPVRSRGVRPRKQAHGRRFRCRKSGHDRRSRPGHRRRRCLDDQRRD